MAITAKKSFTLKKKDLATSKIPAVGFRKTVAYHKATAGDTSINLAALSMPTEMSSAGYSNPTVQTLLAADLTFYRDNLAVISSARGYLQPGLSYNVSSNTNIVFSDSFGTALADEIFTLIIDPVAKTGVEFVDGVALPVTGSLAAGTQDFNIGVPFEANKFPTTQMGVYQVFYDGVLQSRNVGNATADPGADGNYQEVAGTGGLASLIRFNVIDEDNAHDIKCIPVGMMIERPSASTRAELERQQGQINKIVEVLSDVSGTPESTFTAAPSEVDLKTFGDRVLDLEANRARIDQDNNWTAVQKLLGVTDGSSPTSGKVGEFISSSVVSNVVLTNGVYATIVTQVFQPGDYLIWGHGNFNATGSDYTSEFTLESTIELAPATSTDNMSTVVDFIKGINFSGFRRSSGIYRLNVSSPTTVYYVVNASRRAGTAPATINMSNSQLFGYRIR
jgi:hypothetical protein